MVSQKTKDRVTYWATKLECPVDENANYENTYVCLWINWIFQSFFAC
jgi:nucleobase:cation symporter-1, NCS1 family